MGQRAVRRSPAQAPTRRAFQVDNTSTQYYKSPYYLPARRTVQPVPAPRSSPPRIDLAQIVGLACSTPIRERRSGSCFHAVGDTGAAKVNSFQTAAQAIANEASVADAMAADLQAGGATAPAFFFHLGDVVYNFGEGQYYYDQFYEPFRAYDRPIFAIPGNHDGSVFGPKHGVPQVPTLLAFLRNFCAPTPGPVARCRRARCAATMTQPGVVLHARRAVRLDHRSVHQRARGPRRDLLAGRHATHDHDEQLEFLTAELDAAEAPARKRNQRAVILACHHPPASVDCQARRHDRPRQTTSTRPARQPGCGRMRCCPGTPTSTSASRAAVDGRQIPYIVAGSGGFSATPPSTGLPAAPITVGQYTLVGDPIVKFGYLTVTVDMSSSKPTLTIEFQARDGSGVQDSVTVQLATGAIS